MGKVRFAKYLIGYTISDDHTRGTFGERLKKEFGKQLEWVNESMFMLHEGDLKQVTRTLKGISDEVKKLGFDHDDFIKLYYAARLEDYFNLPERDLVKEVNISATV